jgi:F-type H+-transporting ATPase subunit alpha
VTDDDRVTLVEVVRDTLARIDEALDGYEATPRSFEVGTVIRVSSGIAQVSGLPDVTADEIVRFPGNRLGIAAGLAPDSLGVILLDESESLSAGAEVRRTGRVADAPVGEALLGRVIDPAGRPLDDGGPLRGTERRPIERDAPAILDRAPVSVPLQTGIKAIDALIPIGRGQRELILGDRQTGKTAIAVDAIINQLETDVVAIYCAIGQRATAVAKVVADLREHDMLERSVVVAAGGQDPPGLQFVAPYAATSMAEYFMDRGRDVLIVYDDLTRHARAYRELSLLLRRPPGREAYPGDIFYIHSRLLERATHLRDERGGGSLTALPIIETQAQNLSAYIPTNLISITDGQIYLSPDLFQKGQLPAIDVGTSVSRVGGKAQLPAYQAFAGDLRLSYAQFEELETFARFGTRLDEQTRRDLERGRRVRDVLRQPEHDLLPVAEQVAVLFAVVQGLFDGLSSDQAGRAEDVARTALRERVPEVAQRIADGGELRDEDRDALIDAVRSALSDEDLPVGERE